MAGFLGNFKIVTNEGIIQAGNTFIIAPATTGKTNAGSGSFITGDLSNTFNLLSATNTVDPDIVDSSTKQASV